MRAIATYWCPLCWVEYHVYRLGTGRRSLRATIRERIVAHVLKKHPGLNVRERSLLADAVASNAWGIHFGDWAKSQGV